MMEKINYSIMYPELSEAGKQKTDEIIRKFTGQLFEIMNDTLVSFTTTIADEIVDDDSWINVRQKTKEALCKYQDTENYGGVNWERVRKVIFEENRELIINDIILDKENEINELNNRINNMLIRQF